MLGVEANTLFIALADHQRVGKGTLYHGIRTPMVLQWPARVPAGQVLSASTLVSSLDIVPTALDAVGLLSADVAATGVGMPFNAGGRLDGRSLIPLLTEPSTAAANTPTVVWRDAIWAELGVAATVKHNSGWQLIALHFPDNQRLTSDVGTTGSAEDLVACEYERLRTGNTWRQFTHTRHCVWRDSNHSLTTSLIGEAHVRFDSNERYQNLHEVEQLLHTPTDLLMQHDYKTRCPRQLLCMQTLFRARASERVHYDGDPAPFGEYTADTAAWGRFTSGGCDQTVLSLPPERCNEGLAAERSVLSCDELASHHTPTAEEAQLEREEEDEWILEPHTALACALSGGDCSGTGCCAAPSEKCYYTVLQTARCRTSCRQTDTWSCELKVPAAQPPPPALALVPQTPPAPPHVPWQTPSRGGVCSESTTRSRTIQAVGTAALTTAPLKHPFSSDGGGSSGSSGTDEYNGALAGCAGPQLYRAARHLCRTQGSRLCTAAELQTDTAKASGCGLNFALVWSADSCGLGDDHFLAVGGSSESGLEPVCVHWQTALPTRCCADEHQPPLPPATPRDVPQWPPPPAPPRPQPPPPPRPPCAGKYQNCYASHCCVDHFRCFLKHAGLQYAQCRPACVVSADWLCTELSGAPAAFPPTSSLPSPVAPVSHGAPAGRTPLKAAPLSAASYPNATSSAHDAFSAFPPSAPTPRLEVIPLSLSPTGAAVALILVIVGGVIGICALVGYFASSLGRHRSGHQPVSGSGADGDGDLQRPHRHVRRARHAPLTVHSRPGGALDGATLLSTGRRALQVPQSASSAYIAMDAVVDEPPVDLEPPPVDSMCLPESVDSPKASLVASPSTLAHLALGDGVAAALAGAPSTATSTSTSRVTDASCQGGYQPAQGVLLSAKDPAARIAQLIEQLK